MVIHRYDVIKNMTCAHKLDISPLRTGNRESGRFTDPDGVREENITPGPVRELINRIS